MVLSDISEPVDPPVQSHPVLQTVSITASLDVPDDVCRIAVIGAHAGVGVSSHVRFLTERTSERMPIVDISDCGILLSPDHNVPLSVCFGNGRPEMIVLVMHEHDSAALMSATIRRIETWVSEWPDAAAGASLRSVEIRLRRKRCGDATDAIMAAY